MEKNFNALAQAQACHAALARYRQDRERNKRFAYGDQWGDLVNVGGRMITEEQFIIEQGSVPLKNNLIRRLVRNVIGVYQAQDNTPHCVARDPAERQLGQTVTALLRRNGELNRLKAMHTRSLEEFLISGMVAHRKWYGERDGRTDCWTDYVHPNSFFVDSGMRDFRSWDCACIGEVHDITYGELCRRFAGNARECRELRKVYDAAADYGALAQCWRDFGYGSGASQSFLMPSRPGACRVIEAWVKECAPSAKGQKWEMRERWRYYFLSPLGDVLAHGDSPYAHGGHPFVVKAYPLIDGEIHSFVADVIDQQKYANRLVTMYDWMVRASAKGVLMIPEDCIPRGSSAAEIAEAWSRHDGVVVYKPSIHGEAPRQVAGAPASAGITELLNLQLGMFEDISGVHGALEGKLTNAAMSAALYDQQTRNATAALSDVLGAYNEFALDGAAKDVRNILQYYTPAMARGITGADLGKLAERWADIDLSIRPAAGSASRRESDNEQLLEIWRSGQITLEEMLQAGSFEYADALLGALAQKRGNGNK